MPTDLTYPEESRMVNLVITRGDGTAPLRDSRDPRPRFLAVSQDRYHPSVQPYYQAWLARKLGRFLKNKM